jgi:transcriptional regulator with XRE-family HTH domain
MPDIPSDLLKQARQESGYSQKELAENLGVSQTQVSRYEKDPGSIPARMLFQWLDLVGLDLSDVSREERDGQLQADPEAPYTDWRSDLDLASRYVDVQAPESLDQLAQKTSRMAGIQIPSSQELEAELQRLRQKPNLMMAGGFDTGKSYLANTLMGQEVLPTSFQPATRVITVVRHVEDRPEWQDEDVWLFNDDLWKQGRQKQKDGQGRQARRERIDISRLDDRSCEDSRILAGSHDILRRYGVHRREVTQKVRAKMEEAHAAVVYADAPLLQACNLIDLPGFGDRPGESRDQDKAKSALPHADVVVYASRVKGHLSGKDLARISTLLRQIPVPAAEGEDFPALGNLFLVATHADRNVSDSDLETIREGGLDRLYSYLSEGALARYRDRSGRDVSIEDLRDQWFPFWAENTGRSRPLIDRLEEILGERLPAVWIQKRKESARDLKQDAQSWCSRSADTYRKAAEESAEQRGKVQKLKKTAEERRERLADERVEIQKYIDSLHEESREEIAEIIDARLDAEQVQDLIENNFDKKGNAKDRAPTLVVEQIESEIEKVIEEKSAKFADRVEEFLEDYEDLTIDVDGDSTGVQIPFDAQGAFAGGLAGAAAYGALAAWASQLGGLGGYILVAQGVSALSALGIGIGGGTAAATAWVAAIGGPVTLGIAIGSIVALGAWRLLSKSWEVRLARKVVSHFDEEDLRGKFLDGVDEYWKETRNAFRKGADAVEADFQEYLAELEGLGSDVEKARKIADRFEAAEQFFRGLPVSR